MVTGAAASPGFSRALIAVMASFATVHAVGGARAHDPGPFVEIVKMLGSQTGAGAPGDRFGGTVLLDGDSLLVGVPEREVTGCGETGAVFVYQRSGDGWWHQQTLIPPVSPYLDKFGGALAVDSDVLVVGNTSPNGGAFVFERVPGNDWVQTQELEIPPSAQLHWFGQAVAVDGGTLVVSAPDEPGTNGNGAVYVFGQSSGLWVEQQRLTASEPSAWADFGERLSLDGTTLVVSADLENPVGAAYVFERAGDEWIEHQRLIPSDASSARSFGTAVALEGDTLLVSDSGASGPEYQNGAVHSFRRTGVVWTEEQRITASDATDFGAFGGTMSLLGTSLLVKGNSAVYVFERDTGSWVERQRLRPSDSTTQVFFGTGVSSCTVTAAIGAPGDDDGGLEAGAVYTFERAGEEWLERDKLVGRDDSAHDQFGRSVAVWSHTAVVGAPYDENGVADAGAAYFYDRSGGTWQATDKVVASDGADGEAFGWSVAVHEGTALVGAVDEPPCGAAYLLVRDGLAWVERQRLEITTDLACSYFGLSLGLWDETALATVLLDHEYTVVAFERWASGSWAESQRITAPPGDERFSSPIALFAGTWAIGSPNDNEAGQDAGAVHIYTRQAGMWVHQQKLTPPSPPPSLGFGANVAMWGGVLAVASERGGVYVYRESGATWLEEAVLTPPDVNVETFGYALAVSPDSVLVGAPREDFANTNSGVVYRFAYEEGSWSAAEPYIAADTAPFDQFGSDIATWMGSSVIAAIEESEAGCHAGAVYAFADSLLFADGFEAGETALWSAVTNP